MFKTQEKKMLLSRVSMFAVLVIAASACGKSSSTSATDSSAAPLQTTTQAQLPNANNPQPYIQTPSSPAVPGASTANAGDLIDPNSTAATVSRPFVSGDPNRFKYAFFAKQDIGLGEQGDAPVFGLVFTADSNFCTRTAVPMFLNEFVVYQLPFVQNASMGSQPLYYTVTAPDIYWPAGGLAPLPSGYYDVGYTTTCLMDNGTGTAHDTPSWNIWTTDATPIDTSETVNYSFLARNETQDISFNGVAQKCQAAVPFFGIHAGNHPASTLLPCVRTTVAPP